MPTRLKSVILSHTNEQTLIFNLNQIMDYKGFDFEGNHLTYVTETYPVMIEVAQCSDQERQKRFVKGFFEAFDETYNEFKGDNQKRFDSLCESVNFWLDYMGYYEDEKSLALTMLKDRAKDLGIV